MPLTADQSKNFSDALNRLANFYDGDHAYNPATYPGAFRQGGNVVNYVPSLKDVATVMQAASVLVADAVAASGASPKALRVDSAQSFLPTERGQARQNLKLAASTYVYSGGNRSLTKDDVGTVFYVDSTQTITVPLLSDCVVGDTLEFWVAAGTLTLAQPAGNSNPVGIPGGGSGQTVALGTGAYTLKRHDQAWRLHTPPNTAVQRSGDTMTGPFVLSFANPYLDLLYSGVFRSRVTVDASGTVIWRDGDSGDNKMYLTKDGALWLKQIGDINSRIESRAAAYTNGCVQSARQVYVGDYDITNGIGAGTIEPYGASCCTGRASIISGDQNDVILRSMRFRQQQIYTPNQGWIASNYA